LRLLAIELALIGALAGLAVLQMHLASDPLTDFGAYYQAGARLNAGGPLYPPATDPAYLANGIDSSAYYRYPPLLAILMRPLALLPYDAAAAIWILLLIGAGAVTVWRLGVRRPGVWLAICLLGVPLAWAFAIGQAQVLVTLLLVLGNPWSIALAAQLKLVPALAAIYWLGRRDWRSLGLFCAFSLGLVAIQGVLMPAETIGFVKVVWFDQVGAVINISPYVVSPVLWAGLLAAGGVAAVVLAPTRWGWAAAAALSVLASPRLLTYMLGSLLAALREPEPLPGPEPAPGPGLPAETGRIRPGGSPGR
jgi:hypothetical protein